MKKILIADDEPGIRNVMSRLLSKKYECFVAGDGEAALKILAEHPDIALLLTDYKMPGMNGIELIEKAHETRPDLAAIIITAFGEVKLSVEAMKRGADDFLEKPITDFAALENLAAEAIEKRSLRDRFSVRSAECGVQSAECGVPGAECGVHSAKCGVPGAENIPGFTGNSEAMEKIYSMIERIAPAKASVLIEGASGTGKELVAKALHDLSPRKDKPFVAVELSAISKELLEAELFGYVDGAFTGALKTGREGRFEAANGGTLFLDEIGEIDLSTQVKLLRVLETRKIVRVGDNKDIPVDFRLVAATNRDLKAMIRTGAFREDLYYRLNVLSIKLPPLRERPGDVALLVKRFIKEFAKENSSPVESIDREALAKLESYPWPGNVRELRNVIEKMVVLASSDTLTVSDLPEEILVPSAQCLVPGAEQATSIDSALSTRHYALSTALAEREQGATLAQREKDAILRALSECGGNKTAAAEKLGISRRTLHRKLNEWAKEKAD